MTEDKDKDKDKNETLTEDQMATAQAAVMLLVKAVINEQVALHVFRDLKTGKPCAVLGRQVEKNLGAQTLVSFTPLVRLFTSDPHLEVEPLTKSDAVVEQPVAIAVDASGRVTGVEEMGESDEDVFDQFQAQVKAKTLN